MASIFETIAKKTRELTPQFLDEERFKPAPQGQRVLESAQRLGEAVREKAGGILLRAAKATPKITFGILESISRIAGAAVQRAPGILQVPKEEREPFIPKPGETLMEVIRRQPSFGFEFGEKRGVVEAAIEKSTAGKIPFVAPVIGFLSEMLLPPYGLKGANIIDDLAKISSKSGVKNVLIKGLKEITEKEADDLATKLAPITDKKVIRAELDAFAKSKAEIAQKPPKIAQQQGFYVNEFDAKDNLKFVIAEGAKSVEISPAIDTFISRTRYGTGWRVSEGKTGTLIAEGKTQKEVIEKARQLIEKNKDEIETAIAKAVDKGGVSPRYAEAPQKPQVAPRQAIRPADDISLQPLAQEARKFKSAEVNTLRNAIVNKTIKPTDQVAVFHGTPYWEDIISSNKGIQSGIRRNTPAALGGRVYVSDSIDNAVVFSQDQSVAFKLKTAYGDLKPDITTTKNIASTGQIIKNTAEESILKGGAATLSKDTFGIESVIVKRSDGSYVELPYKGGSQELIDKIKSVKQGIPQELESLAKVARESKTADDFLGKFKPDELGNFCINI